MAPEFTPQLVILDLRFENGKLKGTLEYVEVVENKGRIRVRWAVEDEPPGFFPVGGGVAYVYKADDVVAVPLSTNANPEPLGNSRYRCQEGLKPDNPWLMYILILPTGYTLTDPQPVPVSAKDFRGRLALYWILKGDDIGRTKVEWGLKELEGNLTSEVERINQSYASSEAQMVSDFDVDRFDTINEKERHIIMDRPIKILFLAANPKDTPRLRLDEEVRAIDQALLQAQFRDRFDIRQHWAVRVLDIQSHLLRHKPDIVHFSGHGSSLKEVVLEDSSGMSHSVSARALSRLFSVLRDNIRCVILNACYSEQQARAIADHIDCVVGMSKAIGDVAAISFAAAFYQAIGYGRNVKTAFDLGCVQIDLESLDEQDTPRLLCKSGNPEEIVFV